MVIRGFLQRFLSSLAAIAATLGLVQLGGGPAVPAAGSSNYVAGIYGSGPTDIVKAAGFNTVNVVGPSRSSLDSLAAKGFKAVVWLGEYDRTASCQFEFSDTTVRNTVTAVAGHPAIAAYQLSDEPNYARLHCANAVQQHRDRAALIKSIDPSKPTYVPISTWDGREGYPYQYFAGVADIMGLDVYPCAYSTGCNFGIIDTAIREAARDGVSRYWAIVQDFADSYYRIPTASELRTQFERWAPSNLEGYFVYHWTYGGIANRPDHLAVLADAASILGWSGGGALGTDPEPVVSSSPSPSPTATSSPSPTPTPSPTVTSPTFRYAPGSIVARDSFVGDGRSWGNADVGGGWSVVNGATSAFTRSGSEGSVVAPTNGSEMAAILGAVSVRDVDATVSMRLSEVKGAGNLFAYLLLRRASASSHLRVGLYVTPSGAVFIRGQNAQGTAVFQDVDTGLTLPARDALRVRVMVTGSSPATILARVWREGTAEPSSWAVNATTNASGVHSWGAIGLRAINYAEAAKTVTFDDLVVRAL